MAIRTKPWAIDNNTHPGQDIRLATAQMLGVDLTASFAGGVPASAGLLVDPGHGVTSPTALKVTQNGTVNMSVNVAAGGGFIRGTQSAIQGVYSLVNDAVTNLTIAAANATNPRRDLILLQARDNAFDAGGINDGRLVVVTGTPAASPVDPSLTAFPNALVLARVTVPAAATTIVNANITDLRSIAGEWFKGRGEVGHMQQTNSQSLTSTAALVTFGGSDLEVAFTAQANRKYKVSAWAQFTASAANKAILRLLENGSGILTGGAFADNSGFGTNVTLIRRRTPAAGAVSYKLQAWVSAGTGSLAIDAGTPAFILVEDIGGVLA